MPPRAIKILPNNSLHSIAPILRRLSLGLFGSLQGIDQISPLQTQLRPSENGKRIHLRKRFAHFQKRENGRHDNY